MAESNLRARERHRLRESFATLAIWMIAGSVAAVFCWILYDLVQNGIRHLTPSFLVEAPRNAGREGGIAPILVSTFWIVLVCMAVSLPVGLGTATLLAEYTDDRSRFGRFVRRSLDALAAVPSIVFGLFGSALFCIYLGLGFSILSGGLTLACMVLPVLIRTAEQGLRSVPDEYRQGAASLGISRVSTLFNVLLPSAMPALLAGFVLGVGRAMAETAALIFTSGYVDRMPESLSDSGRAMAVHIYDLAMNIPGGNDHAYATALVLVACLLAINGVSSWLGHRIVRKGKKEA